MDKDTLDRTTGEIIGAAIKVHSKLGPGLLESAYRACLVHELRRRGMPVATEQPVSVVYEGINVDIAYRIDVLVQDAVIVELKAIASVLPVHVAQLLSYLRLGGYPVGLLINFHSFHLKTGITRLVNNFRPKCPAVLCVLSVSSVSSALSF